MIEMNDRFDLWGGRKGREKDVPSKNDYMFLLRTGAK